MAKKPGNRGQTQIVVRPCESCGTEMRPFFKMVHRKNNPLAVKKKPRLYWGCPSCGAEEKH